MTSNRAAWILGAALLFSGGACGDDSDDPSGTGGSSTASTAVSGEGGAGGTGGGIGLPSDQYPAPHGEVPQVIDAGGDVLATPHFVPIVFESDTDTATLSAIGDLGAALPGSDYWHSTTTEYGVGDISVGAVVTIAEAPAATISPGQVESWLRDKLDADDAALPPPDEGNIYVVFYPQGVSVGDASGSSCTAFGGYHSNVVLDAAHGSKTVAYAVIPRCQSFGGLGLLDALTVTTSHELIEASTDPYPADTPAFFDVDEGHHYWANYYGGGEVSDMCNLPGDQGIVLPGTSLLVQRSWSNAAALAGKDPCLPTHAGMIYSNASPDLPDDIALPAGYVAKGVKIPLGGSRTIDLHLFSEAAADTLKVQPEDYSKITGGSEELQLSLDQDEGKNGQILHLTIHVVGSKKVQLFRLSNYDGHQWTYWVGAVGR